VKKRLYEHCRQLAENRVASLSDEIGSVRLSVESEGKSTVGDKHETGRAMMHLEQEKLHQQLKEAQQLLTEIESTNPEMECERIQKGAFVETDKAKFYVIVGLGRVNFEGLDVFVVSHHSPIAKQMLGLQHGQQFHVNGREYVIQLIQ
jgi:transcription elongation GreA/GreB family factor